uniref:Psi-conotoxin PIIIE n=2 Tax=Conus purpurascens TaxID=41690 RepID=CM3E_CONPU|nr:RecName: Full=Psi-conotoxin PIIIE; AltName: Full=Psi-conotoxin P3.8; Flags: Precursor [Conus purpurascens]
MSKLGALLTICLLLFPITALLMDGDQPADRPAERMDYDISSEVHRLLERRHPPCCMYGRCRRYPGCSSASCCQGG